LLGVGRDGGLRRRGKQQDEHRERNRRDEARHEGVGSELEEIGDSRLALLVHVLSPTSGARDWAGSFRAHARAAGRTTGGKVTKKSGEKMVPRTISYNRAMGRRIALV